MAEQVTGELYESTTGQLFEIGRQLRQPKGYPYDPRLLKCYLQAAVEGRFFSNYLTVPTSITLPAIEKLGRLHDTDGVWVTDRAVELFKAVKKLLAANERVLERRDFTRNLDSFQIMGDLGGEKASVFPSIGMLETTISQLIAQQLGGTHGHLAKDGSANIFYVRNPKDFKKVWSVEVRWDTREEKWKVDCFSIDFYQWIWGAGGRVFRATAAQT